LNAIINYAVSPSSESSEYGNPLYPKKQKHGNLGVILNKGPDQ